LKLFFWGKARGNLIKLGLPFWANSSIAGPPGKPKPRSFAALSKLSPAASSRVFPTTVKVVKVSKWTSSVCPPETTRAKKGGSTALCSIKLAKICDKI